MWLQGFYNRPTARFQTLGDTEASPEPAKRLQRAGANGATEKVSIGQPVSFRSDLRYLVHVEGGEQHGVDTDRRRADHHPAGAERRRLALVVVVH